MTEVGEDTDDEDGRLEKAAVMLEAMAQELRRRKQKTRTSKTRTPSEDRPTKDAEATGHAGCRDPKGGEPKKQSTKKSRELHVGDRIELVRKGDVHRTRQGVVVRRRGSMYWDLQLDTGIQVYRMASSLRRVE